MDPVPRPFNKKMLISIGVAAAVLAVLGIVLVTRQTKIPEPGNTLHNGHKLISPTLQPTIPQTLDDRLKSLQDTVVGIDQNLQEEPTEIQTPQP